jgi:pimeloyl-ACP methyl ester carboxylesterase
VALAPVAGTSIYYEEAGIGPAVVLIHAGVADSRMWDGVFEPLARRFRTVRFDIRGFGRSSMPPGRFSYHGDLRALLDHLDIARAALVACSFGGQIAIDLAIAHPGRVGSLVLVASGIGGREPSESMVRFGEEEDALMERGDVEGATELNLRTWVDGPKRATDQVDPAVRKRVHDMQRELFLAAPPEGVKREPLTPAAIGRLGEIEAPTLVLVGDLDVPDMIEASELLATGIPNARRVVFPGVAHMVSMERPEQFLEAVVEFLGGSA